MGPLGSLGVPGPASTPRALLGQFWGENKNPNVGPKWANKNVEIEGVEPIWRDPERNSVQNAVPGVPYGGMATHLVQILCGSGSVGVPGLASTP